MCVSGSYVYLRIVGCLWQFGVVYRASYLTALGLGHLMYVTDISLIKLVKNLQV